MVRQDVEKLFLRMLLPGYVSYLRLHSTSYRLTQIIQELGVPFINISAPSIVSGMSGESEKTLRDTFDEAKVGVITMYLGHPLTLLQRLAPCLLFIDEIDAITPKRESAQREMERRIVAQFLTCMDGLCMSPRQNYNTLTTDDRAGMGKNGEQSSDSDRSNESSRCS
jgi:hypothetical protein